MERYYCRGAAGPHGHCDNKPGYIQCDHCIWVEEELKNNPNHPTNMYLTKRRLLETDLPTTA